MVCSCRTVAPLESLDQGNYTGELQIIKNPVIGTLRSILGASLKNLGFAPSGVYTKLPELQSAESLVGRAASSNIINWTACTRISPRELEIVAFTTCMNVP